MFVVFKYAMIKIFCVYFVLSYTFFKMEKYKKMANKRKIMFVFLRRKKEKYVC